MIRALFIPLLCSWAVLLSACGFTPMHGASGAAAPLANIDIDLVKDSRVINNQSGFLIAQRLRDRVGNGSETAPYRLETKLSSSWRSFSRLKIKNENYRRAPKQVSRRAARGYYWRTSFWSGSRTCEIAWGGIGEGHGSRC